MSSNDQLQSIQHKLMEQNARLLQNIDPLTNTGPQGIPINKMQVNLQLLSHQLNCGCRLKQLRGKMHQMSAVRTDYICASYKHCPFLLVRMDYHGFPDVSYFQLKKAHLHISDPIQDMKNEQHSEIAAYIRQYQGKFPSIKQIIFDVQHFIETALNTRDFITAQHRRQFPTAPLQIVTYDINDLLPSKQSLYKKVSYYRKQQKMFDPNINATIEVQNKNLDFLQQENENSEEIDDKSDGKQNRKEEENSSQKQSGNEVEKQKTDEEMNKLKVLSGYVSGQQ